MTAVIARLPMNLRSHRINKANAPVHGGAKIHARQSCAPEASGKRVNLLCVGGFHAPMPARSHNQFTGWRGAARLVDFTRTT